MTGKKQIWEIDKAERRIRYAPEVLQQGWVGSREESTVNGSDITVVAYKGSEVVSKKSTVLNPKVKIETLSGELLKGLGKEVLDYAIPLIDPEAKDWVLDLVSSAIKYEVSGGATSSPYTYRAYDESTHYSPESAAISNCLSFGRTGSPKIDSFSGNFAAVSCGTSSQNGGNNSAGGIVRTPNPDYVSGDGGSVPTGEFLYAPYHVQNDTYGTPEAACTIGYKVFYESIGMTNVAAVYDSDNQCKITHSDGSATQQIVLSINPDYNPDAPSGGEKYIPIDTVSQQVIDNADAGHLESKEFLKSIPLFAYLLTGSGTEAVNKAVLDIDPEATDWVLDPANNSVKYEDLGDSEPEHDGYCYAAPVSWDNGWFPTAQAACSDYVKRLNEKNGTDDTATIIYNAAGNVSCKWRDPAITYSNKLRAKICSESDLPPPKPVDWIHIPIDEVAEQVIANAEAGHTPSQEALRLSTVERVNIGEYNEALEATSTEIDTSWKYLPIYDVAVQVKRNSIAGHAESIEAVNNSLPFVIPNYEPNVTITGIAKVGEILTATVTDENGVPSNINYQWYADGEVISGATAETYVVKESDSGKTITVQAGFTDRDGFSESVTDTVDVENVATDMGLRADYSGTGWYKATDTGTVFNKGVPALETHVFSDSTKEYVSVYTKEDAKLYGERAAVSNITDMSSVFEGNSTFNEDVSSWDVSSVTNMSGMFDGATAFNSDLSNWDVSSVTDMSDMFYNDTSFNSDISSWDVSSASNMRNMFYKATSFNSDISSWNASSVSSMYAMFYEATAFNQDLSGWCVTLIPSKPSYFDYSATAWTLPRPVWGTCPRGELG